jgi:hypothetical protein
VIRVVVVVIVVVVVVTVSTLGPEVVVVHDADLPFD